MNKPMSFNSFYILSFYKYCWSMALELALLFLVGAIGNFKSPVKISGRVTCVIMAEKTVLRLNSCRNTHTHV